MQNIGKPGNWREEETDRTKRVMLHRERERERERERILEHCISYNI